MRSGKSMLHIFILFVFMTLAGCGSGGGGDNETNGTIELNLVETDIATGQFKVDAQAIISRPFPDVEVVFKWKRLSPSDPAGTALGNSGSELERTDATGRARHTFYVGQTTENQFFEVTAKTGDVTSGAIGVTIPAIP